MYPHVQNELDSVASAYKIAGIVCIIWGVLWIWSIIVGGALITGGILMVVASGKIRRGEKCFVFALVGNIIPLVFFSTLVPLISLWPMIKMLSNEEVKKVIT